MGRELFMFKVRYAALTRALAIAFVSGCLVIGTKAPPAFAGEGPFAFIYTLDLQPTGTFQLQQWEWLQQSQSQGRYSFLTNRTELEYGVTNWYQIGLYLNSSYAYARRNGVDGMTGGAGTDPPMDFDPLGTYSKARFESVSMENVIRLLNPYTDEFGFGLYFEPAFGPKTREMEMKLLFQKNFFGDRLITSANIVFDVERDESATGEVEKASVVEILLGASYQIADNWMVGAEFRNHREFTGYSFNQRDHSAYFFGPTVHYATKDWWATLGWRHQLPWAECFSQDQCDVVVSGRIYGDEHPRDEIMLRVGIPFGGERHDRASMAELKR